MVIILGNIWGQSWTNLLDVTLPYPGKTYPEVTLEMQAQVKFPRFLNFVVVIVIIHVGNIINEKIY